MGNERLYIMRGWKATELEVNNMTLYTNFKSNYGYQAPEGESAVDSGCAEVQRVLELLYGVCILRRNDISWNFPWHIPEAVEIKLGQRVLEQRNFLAVKRITKVKIIARCQISCCSSCLQMKN